MRRDCRQSGFTLIEIVIAFSLLSLVVSVTYGALSGIMRGKKLLDDGRDAGIIANSVLIRLTRELQLVYRDAALLNQRSSTAGSGSGGNTNYGALRGEENSMAQGVSGDTISFVALDGGQYLPDGTMHSGLVQISYRLLPDPDSKREGIYTLVREEVPYIRPEKKAFEKKMVFPLAKNVASLRFRYYDKKKNEWTTNWVPPRNGIPALIEFTLETQSELGKIDSYTSAVAIRAAE